MRRAVVAPGPHVRGVSGRPIVDADATDDNGTNDDRSAETGLTTAGDTVQLVGGRRGGGFSAIILINVAAAVAAAGPLLSLVFP